MQVSYGTDLVCLRSRYQDIDVIVGYAADPTG